MEFGSLHDWLPIIGVVVAALIAGLVALLGNMLLFRRSGQEMDIKSAAIQVSAAQVLVSQSEASTHAQAELRASFDSALEIQNGVICNLDAHVKRLQIDVDECKKGSAAKDLRVEALSMRILRLEQAGGTA